MKTKLYQFFDVYNPEHLKAYQHLRKYGKWPVGFITEDIEMGPYWQFEILENFAFAWMYCAFSQRWPTEIQIQE